MEVPAGKQTHSVMLVLMVFLIALIPSAETREPRGIDADRELARFTIAEHLRNQKSAPQNGFLPAVSKDFGNIAVIEASTKTGTSNPANKFDLSNKSLSFKRAADASYLVQVGASRFSANTGSTIVVAPGQAQSVKLPFAFPFYRSNYNSVFVHASGNLTFGKPATVPFGLSEQQIFHVAPRMAPLVTWSLTQPAEITITAGASQVAFLWEIPAVANVVRVQAVLLKTGDFSFHYETIPANTIAVTGITPGPSSLLPQAVDFSRGSLPAVRAAVVEDFSPNSTIDQIAIAQAFLDSHPDTFDMIALFFSVKHPGRPSVPGIGVDVIYQNNIRGIGRAQYNFARVLGTTGRLKAIASHFDFEAYPQDPRQSFPGFSPELGRTPLELVSHEIAHYWLASPKLLENGAVTTRLLSDGCCHWSFTFDADGSFMNGNDIQDNGNGSFTTTNPLVRFSKLDQYLMGLIPASDVGPMFYVSNASGVSPSDDARRNVTFSGTRVNVTMDQIIAATGTRVPAHTASQRSFRVAFILIVDEGRKPTQNELQKLERLRAAWPSYFQTAASNKLTISTTLTD